MSAPLPPGLGWGDWLNLFTHFMMLSLLSVGGTISTIPEMHRFLVDRQHWLSDPQFNGAIAIAQAAPGPNVLFVALMGWNVGHNSGGVLQALTATLLVLFAVLLPSSTLTFFATRWLQRNRGRRAVRAFTQGMAPIVIGLMFSTSWILASVHHNRATDLLLWLVTLATALIVWRTRIHILWLLGAGAVLGWFHLI